MADGNYRKDREFGDRFMPEVKAILGQFLLRDDFTEEDCKRNTDLIVLKMDAVRIGVRIRTHDYLMQYGDEFTIRYIRPSGAKTEFRKILEGWGDYFFYGFANADGTHLEKWIIGDYDVFRKTLKWTAIKKIGATCVEDVDKIVDERKRRNKGEDGSWFLPFKQNEIKGFVVASSDEWNMKRAS